MKKLMLALVALALLLPVAAQAQSYPVDRGSWIVGGGASLTSQSNNDDEDDRATSASISPRAQYFVLPGLALGTSVSLGYTSRDNGSSTRIGIGPTASYYFGRDARTIYPFVSAGVSISQVTVEFDTPELDFELPSLDFDNTTTSTTWDLSGGLVVMIAKNVGLTGSAFYQKINIDNDDDPLFLDLDTDIFGLRFGVQVFAF